MSPLRLPEGGGGLVEPCVRGTRVINQVPKTCGRKSSRIPARLDFNCAPPSLWELEDLEALWSSIFLPTASSHVEFREQNAAIKRALDVFYPPDGIMHHIYAFPVIHGGPPTVTFLFLGTSRRSGRASLSGGGSKLPSPPPSPPTPKRTTSLRTTSSKNSISFSLNRWARGVLIKRVVALFINACFY